MTHADPNDQAEPVAQPMPTEQPISTAQPVFTDADEAGAERVDTAKLLQIGRTDVESDEAEEQRSLSESYAMISAVLGVIGLIGGLFVVWTAPFAIGAVVFAELTRRHAERNLLSRIGFITGIIGVLFAGVWGIYYFLLFAG